MKNPSGSVAHKISSLSVEERELLSTSVIVACELRFGAAKKHSAVLEERVRQLLDNLIVLALSPRLTSTMESCGPNWSRRYPHWCERHAHRGALLVARCGIDHRQRA